MSSDYIRLSHRRTVFAQLQRYLLQTFIGKGSDPPKEELTCEEVFYADRLVSQEALLEVLDSLSRQEADEHSQMAQYELRRRHVQPSSPKSSDEEPKKEEVRDPEPPPGSSPPPPGGKPAGRAPAPKA